MNETDNLKKLCADLFRAYVGACKALYDETVDERLLGEFDEDDDDEIVAFKSRMADAGIL